MTDTLRMRVDVDSGKYTVIQEADGRLHALRNGLPWRECVGDKLVFHLAAELQQAREALVKIASVESRPQDKDTWTGRAMLTMRQTARSTLQYQGVPDPAASPSEVPTTPNPTA